jgi:hypothetical protein
MSIRILADKIIRKAVPEKRRASALKLVWQHILDPAAIGWTDEVFLS